MGKVNIQIKINVKSRACYYLDHCFIINDPELKNILLSKVSQKNLFILLYQIINFCILLKVKKINCIYIFRKINGYIKGYDGSKYSILIFSNEKIKKRGMN